MPVDVVPVNPETISEWAYPPYSGHFDGMCFSFTHIQGATRLIKTAPAGESIWGRGSSDDKSGLIGTVHVRFT